MSNPRYPNLLQLFAFKPKPLTVQEIWNAAPGTDDYFHKLLGQLPPGELWIEQGNEIQSWDANGNLVYESYSMERRRIVIP